MIVEQMNNNSNHSVLNKVVTVNKVMMNPSTTALSSPITLGASPLVANGVLTNSNGILSASTSVMSSGGVITVPLNRVVQQNNAISTNNIIAPVQQNRILTQQQLQKLLEQQLQQQQIPNNGHPQIIRLASPQITRMQPQQQQQIIRLPQIQPAQVIRTPGQIIRAAQPGQIIRIPQGQLAQFQQSQSLNVLPQPITLTPQQLQQIQNLQQRGQSVTLSTTQPQHQVTTASNAGMQVISMANAQAILQSQQQLQLTNSQHLPKILPAPNTNVTPVSTISSVVPSSIQSVVNPQLQQFISQNNAISNNNIIKLTPSGTTSANQSSTPTTMFNGSHNTTSVLTPQNLANINYNNHVVENNFSMQNGRPPAKQVSGSKENTIKGALNDEEDDDIEEIEVIKNVPANGLKMDKYNTFKEEIKADQEDSSKGVIDIIINNVVCSFSIGCHIDLREVAMTACNVEYKRENGMVTMKLRNPLTTASVWSSGKITCTGSTSEPQAKTAARRVARVLQQLGCNARFRNFRVVNVLGTCVMPFGIKITNFSLKHKHDASYEPELHPGVTYKIKEPKATLKIFSTGSITVTAPSVYNVQKAIEHIYPLVSEFGKERTPEEEARRAHNTYIHFHQDDRRKKRPGNHPVGMKRPKIGKAFTALESDEDMDDEEYLMKQFMNEDDLSDSSDDDADMIAV